MALLPFFCVPIDPSFSGHLESHLECPWASVECGWVACEPWSVYCPLRGKSWCHKHLWCPVITDIWPCWTTHLAQLSPVHLIYEAVMATSWCWSISEDLRNYEIWMVLKHTSHKSGCEALCPWTTWLLEVTRSFLFLSSKGKIGKQFLLLY